MARRRAARKSIKGKQKFHAPLHVRQQRQVSLSEPAGIIVSNSGTYFRKIPVRTFLKEDKMEIFSHYSAEPKIAMEMTLGESVALNGVLRQFNSALKKSSAKKSFSLRGPKILRVGVSKTNPNENFILMELIKKPTVTDLDKFIETGYSGKGFLVDSWCTQFIKENNLGNIMNSSKMKEEFRIKLNEIAGFAILDLKASGSLFKKKAMKRNLPSNFKFDFMEKNLLIESFSGGKFSFVLIDPSWPVKFGYDFPSARTQKRNKRKEVESKGRTYNSKGHPKRNQPKKKK